MKMVVMACVLLAGCAPRVLQTAYRGPGAGPEIPVAIYEQQERSQAFNAAAATARNVTPQQQAAKLATYQLAVASAMRDPASAQFRGLSMSRNIAGRDVLCGQINAKNGFGGYTGFDPFYAEIITDDAGTKAFTVPFLASAVGTRYVMERCPSPV